MIAGPTSHTEDYAESLRRMAGPNVIFTGAVTGRLLEELYSHAYLYVLPSDVEGLPHSLLHALSFGKCVVASDIEANREAMGECGVTFRRADVADLRATLAALLADPDRVRARRRWAGAHATRIHLGGSGRSDGSHLSQLSGEQTRTLIRHADHAHSTSRQLRWRRQ